MKKAFLSILLFLSLFFIGGYAQIDTEFWFAAPRLSPTHGYPNSMRVKLCIITFGQAANVVISQPAITDPDDPDYFVPITRSIAANSYYEESLETPYTTSHLGISHDGRAYPFGLYIKSDVSISAYYAIPGDNSEIYSLKGRNALGYEFIVPMQTTYSNNVAQIAWSSIEIVAPENGTEITIETRVPTSLGVAGTHYRTLNRGEACAFRADARTGAEHIHNTKITSTKPIAVNTTDDSLIGAGGGSSDLVGDQIIPLNLTGSEYIAIKNEGNAEKLYIFGVEPDTKIYVNGGLAGTVNPGTMAQVDLSEKANYINSADDKKFIVFQLTSIGGELGGTMLPRIGCTGSNNIVYRPAFSSTLPIVNLLVKTSDTSFFTLNGGAVNSGNLTNADFKPVPDNPLWSYCSKQLPTGTGGIVRIQNNRSPFHAGILEGSTAGSLSYGYFSDYNTATLRPAATKPYYMEDELVELKLPNESVLKDIVWTTPSGAKKEQPDLVFEASLANAGIYQVTATHKEGCIIDLILDVVVHVFKSETLKFTVCRGEEINLTANGAGPYRWESSTGSFLSDSIIFPVTPQTNTNYTVTSSKRGKNLFFGDFEGSSEFSSDYTEETAVTTNGTFALAGDASTVNPSFGTIYDHTKGDASGKHMIVKCGTEPRKKIWSKRVQLEQNTRYDFSAWFLTAEKGGVQPKLIFTINEKPVGDVIVPSNTVPTNPGTGTTTDEWEAFSCIWNSETLSEVTISIETADGITDGVAVCIDDIVFAPLYPVTDRYEVRIENTVPKPTIEGENICNGQAVLRGGTMDNDVPYSSYKWYNSDMELIGSTRVITITEAGEYLMEVSNGTACMETASYTVEVSEKIEISIIEPLSKICAGDAEFYVEYNTIKGVPGNCEISFDQAARDAGFVNSDNLPFSEDQVTITLPANVRPDIYRAELTFTDDICGQIINLPLEFMVRYPEDILTQRWNDVLGVKNFNYNSGYTFTDFQWYKNDVLMTGQTSSYIYEENFLDETDQYSVLLTRSDGVTVFTCDFTPERLGSELDIPTVVMPSQVVKIKNISSSGTAVFRNKAGQTESIQSINNQNSEIRMPSRKGLYILTISTDENLKSYKIIVK